MRSRRGRFRSVSDRGCEPWSSFERVRSASRPAASVCFAGCHDRGARINAKHAMTHARSDYRVFERLRVRWAEVDMQQIVFNGHYLMYFDTAVAGYWRALAIPYHETMAYLGGDFFVRKSTAEYTSSARYDDQIDVGVRTQRT